MKTILLLSGLDSYIAWHYLGKYCGYPATLYCALGHRYEPWEHDWIINLVPDTKMDTTVSLGKWEKPDAFIPMRNAYLIMVASNYGNDIVLTVQKGEATLADRSKQFFEEMQQFLTEQLGGRYMVRSPFWHLTKTQMVEWYLENKFSPKNLLLTRSCYAILNKPCGKCSACFRRWVAFTNNDLEEDYDSPVIEWDGIPGYIERMKNNEYDVQRAYETFKALAKGGYNFAQSRKEGGN